MMEQLETAFEDVRPLLFSLAYRMLGSAAEAEDVVQDSFLRWQAAPRAEVASAKAYLTTIATRLCLDRLKSARAQRETYIGPWLPEPMRTDSPPDRESISTAFLVLLETLGPVERAVYLLREALDFGHEEIAEIIGHETAAVRQIFHRAQERVREGKPRFAPTREQHERLLAGFFQAMLTGDLAGLKAVLADDVIAMSDGGGKVKGAGLKPVHGADAVARLYLGLMKKQVGGNFTVEIVELNGWPALLVRLDGAPFTAINFETDGEKIFGVRSVVNPDKLTRI
jgi:RNA polymerase sigma-70 factor (ECF subfamily)